MPTAGEIRQADATIEYQKRVKRLLGDIDSRLKNGVQALERGNLIAEYEILLQPNGEPDGERRRSSRRREIASILWPEHF